MLAPPSWRLCSTARTLAAGAAGAAKASLLLWGGRAVPLVPFRKSPATWVSSPAAHSLRAFWHLSGWHAESLRPGTGMARAVLGVCGSHVTNFSIALAVTTHGRSRIISLFHHLYFECYNWKAFLQSSLHKKLGKLSTSPTLTSCFHRKVVPANKGRGQVYRENMGKITCKPIPYQSFIKTVKKKLLCTAFPHQR